jgi:hypothetical protein
VAAVSDEQETGVPFLGAILDGHIVMAAIKAARLFREAELSGCYAYLAIAELAGRPPGTLTTGSKPFAGPGKPARRASLGRECHPSGSRTTAIASACEVLARCPVSEDGRETTHVRDLRLAWMCRLCRRDERALPLLIQRARPDVTPAHHQRGQLRHHHQLERRSQHGIYHRALRPS